MFLVILGYYEVLNTGMESGLSAFTGNVIRVYDWNGDLLKIYTCNTDLTALCVSADDSIMYAIGLVEDYELLVANLK